MDFKLLLRNQQWTPIAYRIKLHSFTWNSKPFFTWPQLHYHHFCSGSLSWHTHTPSSPRPLIIICLPITMPSFSPLPATTLFLCWPCHIAFGPLQTGKSFSAFTGDLRLLFFSRSQPRSSLPLHSFTSVLVSVIYCLYACFPPWGWRLCLIQLYILHRA